MEDREKRRFSGEAPLREEAHKIKGGRGKHGGLGIGEVAKALENEGVRKNGEELERLLAELKTLLETLRRHRKKWEGTEGLLGAGEMNP